MMTHSCKVLQALQGKTLATAESCTGGMIGEALTAVPGSSAVYKGGIISDCNEAKARLLDVPQSLLDRFGPVSEPVAVAMAEGARNAFSADVAVSVTGIAGPGGDGSAHEVGTVVIGYSCAQGTFAKEFHFPGDRDAVRRQAAQRALQLILENA